MPAGFRRQLGDDVVPILDQVGALFYQQVRAPAQLVGDVAGDGEDFAALVDGELGGDGGTGVLSALHDQDTEAHAADDAVADGEVLGKCGGAHGEFGDDEPARGELTGELPVLAGVDDVDAAAEDGDGIGGAAERSLVSGGVDSTGHAADDGEAGIG